MKSEEIKQIIGELKPEIDKLGEIVLPVIAGAIEEVTGDLTNALMCSAFVQTGTHFVRKNEAGEVAYDSAKHAKLFQVMINNYEAIANQSEKEAGEEIEEETEVE